MAAAAGPDRCPGRPACRHLLETYLNVLRALGRLDDAVTALDPYETDLGRARADQVLPKRVRR